MNVSLAKSCSYAVLTAAVLSASVAFAQPPGDAAAGGSAPASVAPAGAPGVSSNTASVSSSQGPATRSSTSSASGSPVTGDAPSSTQLTQIVVTAQRRSENIQKAPIAVEAVSADTLARNNITSTATLSRLVPALQNSQAGGPFLTFFLRGVGSSTANALTDPAVEISLDDVPLARQYGSNGQFYDIQRVEVLKGPQGTLYGRNATGGVVNIIPQHPLFSDSEDLGVTLGNYNDVQTNGALNLKLTDTSAARLSFQTIRHDGYLSDGEQDEDSQAARLQYRIDPVHNLSIVLSGDYVHQGGRGGGYAVQNDGFTDRDRVGLADPRVQAYYTSKNLIPITPSELFNDNDFGGVKGELTYKTDLGALTIIPSYRLADVNYVSANGDLLTNKEFDHQTSIEGRFAFNEYFRFRPTIGAYYLADNGTSRFPVNNLTIPQTTPGSGNTQTYRQSTTAHAFFADTTFRITDTIHLFGGIRYTGEDKTLDGTLVTFATYVPTLRIDANKTFISLDYRAGAEWNILPNSLVYGSISTGFHSGGFFFTHDNPTYAPERLKAYTIGVKNEFLDHRLRVNLELFDWKYTNQQISGVTDDSVGATVFATQNAGRSTVKGGELETQYKLFADTLIGADAQYLDSQFNQFTFLAPFPPAKGFACATAPTGKKPLAFSENCAGEHLPESPTWTVTLAGQQAFHLATGATLTFNVNTHYQTSSYVSINYLPPDLQNDYILSDFSLTYEPTGGRYSVTGYCNNCTDATVKASALDQNVDAAFLRPPRTFGARIGAHF